MPDELTDLLGSQPPETVFIIALVAFCMIITGIVAVAAYIITHKE